MNRKKIAIIGGSFSPIHIGHASIAEELIRSSLAEEVWLMPCRRNPLKAVSPIDDRLRLHLLDKAAAYVNGRLCQNNSPEDDSNACPVKICRLELELPVPSYTWKTLDALKKKFPDFDFAVAIGADSCADFDKWARAEWIKENFEIMVYPRPGTCLEDVKTDGFVVLDEVRLHDVSSTEIRKFLSTGELPEGLMPWADKNDINNMKNLYYGRE